MPSEDTKTSLSQLQILCIFYKSFFHNFFQTFLGISFHNFLIIFCSFPVIFYFAPISLFLISFLQFFYVPAFQMKRSCTFFPHLQGCLIFSMKQLTVLSIKITDKTLKIPLYLKRSLKQNVLTKVPNSHWVFKEPFNFMRPPMS